MRHLNDIFREQIKVKYAVEHDRGLQSTKIVTNSTFEPYFSKSSQSSALFRFTHVVHNIKVVQKCCFPCMTANIKNNISISCWNTMYRTHFPFHVRGVSSLASAKKIQPARAIRKSGPGCWGKTEGGTHTILMLAGISGDTVNFSGFPKGGVLKSQGTSNQHYSYCLCVCVCVWLFRVYKSIIFNFPKEKKNHKPYLLPRFMKINVLSHSHCVYFTHTHV